MSDYKVSVISPEEAREVIEKLKYPGTSRPRRTIVLEGGMELKGSFEITARDAKTGNIEWQHADENLITDYGRKAWMDVRFSSFTLGFQASTEPPTPARCTLSGALNQFFTSGNLSPVNNSVTNTKTVSTTFGTPANNRTLGTISLTPANETFSGQGFRNGILAYALLTPPKTQTTTQTLEVVYKISMSPIS